jgi:tetratricopeptide (TPR) repeat protein
MARAFLSFTTVLAAATVILFGAGAMPVLAQVPAADPTATSKSNQYPEVREAVQLLLGPNRDKPRAVKVLENAARRYPELPTAHVLMYQILVQLNQQTAARLELEAAVRADPSDPDPFVILGNIASQEGRVAEASMDFEKAQTLLAKYTNAQRKPAMQQQTHSGLAAVAELHEEWKEAEAHLRDLLKLSPENLVAHQRLARCLFWQGLAKDAYAVLKEAKKIDRANAQEKHGKEIFLTPEAIMAQYYEQYEGPNSNTGNAENWFKAAVQKAPDDLPTRQVVAVWALERGKVAFAKEQAEAALRVEAADALLPPAVRKYSGSNLGHVLRGLAALWEKDWPEAEKDFQKVVDDSPAEATDFIARNNLALALVEQDDQAKKQRALEYAEANVRDHKHDADAFSTLAWVRFRRNEFDDAQAAIEQSLKANGGGVNNADTATYQAHILHQQGKKQEASNILNRILISDRPFSMRPEAKKLYEKLRDADKADAAPDAETETP